jgi:hypothetical protein
VCRIMVMRKIHRDKSHYTNWPVLDSTPRGVLTQPSPAFILTGQFYGKLLYGKKKS